MTWTPPASWASLPTPIALMTAFREPVDISGPEEDQSLYFDLAAELVGADKVNVITDLMVFQHALLKALSAETGIPIDDLLRRYGRAGLVASEPA